MRSEDEILAAELASLAPSGGRLTSLAARRMKKDVHEVEVSVPLPFEEAVERVVGVLRREGRPVEPPVPGSGGGEHTVRAVVRGGAGAMNPVVVTALVAGDGKADTTVRLRATAKEGLIKQRAGQKTARRLAALLTQEAPG